MVGWVNLGEVSCGSVEVGRPADVVVVGGQRAFVCLVERALVETVLEDGLDGANRG